MAGGSVTVYLYHVSHKVESHNSLVPNCDSMSAVIESFIQSFVVSRLPSANSVQVVDGRSVTPHMMIQISDCIVAVGVKYALQRVFQAID